ncbi:M24 family metallopeptidase [Candidatus Poriferisodalis sp.]|uniref:M24 family metallopeptidase n=1 Tax=Candidatus Poriferisodalis sp. TaxID=3101277 RepID=UPI003AF64CFC
MAEQSFESRHRPKIGIARAEPPEWLLDHTELNMHALGPGAELEAEWLTAGLELPDRPAMRKYRLERVRERLRSADCDAALLYDPVNIRYATDTTNMSLWTMHNAVRFAVVNTDGPVVVFEFSDGEFLDAHSEAVDEIRPAPSYTHFLAGPRAPEIAQRWAVEVADLVSEHARTSSRRLGGRLAVDRLDLGAARALESHGIELVAGEPLMETARTVKSADEIRAMRCAVHACEAAIGEMEAIFEPGVSELDLWAALWAGSLRRYGEWIETRLLSSGPRTNPWYQEASSRRVQAGELMGFDTDLVGAYGMCVDMSRTWLCGNDRPSASQHDTWSLAAEQIQRNTELFQAGTPFRELTEAAWYPDPDEYRHYTSLAHGVGLCDEYPSVTFRHKWDRVGYDGVLEPGMVVCVEAYVGPRSGGEGVKLEDQVLITATGNEVLTTLPLGLFGRSGVVG